MYECDKETQDTEKDSEPMREFQSEVRELLRASQKIEKKSEKD